MNQKIIIMKILLLFMFVSIALTTQESEVSQDELVQKLAKTFRIDPIDSLECVHKSEVTTDDMRYVPIAMHLDDAEAMDVKSFRRAICTLACCAQKLGIMVGGEILVESLFDYFRNSSMPEETKMSLHNSMLSCKEQVTGTYDECMVGYEFSKCVYGRTQSMVQHK